MRRLLLTTLLVCALGFSFTTARAQTKTQKIVKDGVEIEFSVELPASHTTEVMAGQDAVFRFKIRDAATKRLSPLEAGSLGGTARTTWSTRA